MLSVAQKDVMLQRQFSKMDEASVMLRIWFQTAFKKVYNSDKVNIDKDVSDSKEYSQFMQLVQFFEPDEKKVTKILIKQNGLVRKFWDGIIPEYLKSKREFLHVKTIEWFEQHYKGSNIKTIQWRYIADELDRTINVFNNTCDRLFVECVIISMEHEIIDDKIKENGQIPTIEEMIVLFEERYRVKQTELFEKYYKET